MNQTRSFVIKLQGGCNLRCTYCYYIDPTSGLGPQGGGALDIEVAKAAVEKIAASAAGRYPVFIAWHGGEPLLNGPDYLESLFAHCRRVFGAASVQYTHKVQTNLTALSPRTLEILQTYEVAVGTSIDGPQWMHDSNRVTPRGSGIFRTVAKNIRRCQDAGLDVSSLTVIQPAISGSIVFDVLYSELGLRHFDFLLPDHNLQTPPARPLDEYSTFLNEVFDRWVQVGDPECHINSVDSILAAFAGREPTACTNSASCHQFYSVESNGMWGLCDTLRGCGRSFQETSLSVSDATVAEVNAVNAYEKVLSANNLSEKCQHCSIMPYCQGGCAQGRWDGVSLNNTSIWCSVYFSWISHMYQVLYPDRPAPVPPPSDWRAQTRRLLYPVYVL